MGIMEVIWWADGLHPQLTLEKSKESIRFRWMELSTGDVCEELDKSEE